MKIKIYILILNLVAALTVNSASVFPNYSFKYFDVKSGLKCTEVFNFSQDDDGLLWLGTNNGLLQFDGYNFFEFDKFRNELQNPPLGNYRFILKHSMGNMWIATDYSGVSEYNPHNKLFTHYNPNKFKDNNVADGASYLMKEDENKNIWFAHYFNGISIFNYNSKKFDYLVHRPNQINSLLSNEIFSLHCDLNQGVWIGYKNSGLSYYNHQTKQFIHYTVENNSGLKSNKIYSITIDKSGTLWIGTDKEIHYKLKGDTKFKLFKHPLLKQQYFFNAYFNKINNLVYFTSLDGLHVIDPITKELKIYKLFPDDKYDKNINRCTNLFFDRNNHLWIQFNQGFCLATEFNNRLFKYNDLIGIGENNRLNFFEVIKDDVIYSIVKNKIIIKKIHSNDRTEVELKMSNDLVQGDVVIYNPGKYSIYLAIKVKNEKLYLFNTIDYKLFQVPTLSNNKIISENKIFDAYVDSKGNIWSIDNYYGLVRYSNLKNKWEVINPNKEKTNTDFYYYPTKFLEDKFGHVWAINPFFKILKYKNGIEDKFTIEQFNEKKYNNNSGVLSIYYSLTDDNQGNLFFAGNNKKLDCYIASENQFYSLKREGCFNDVTTNLHIDKTGKLWCYNQQSIYKLQINLNTLYQNEFEYRSYDWKNGFEGNYFGNNFVFETQNGTLYFDSKASLMYMNPNEWDKSIQEVNTILRGIYVNEQYIQESNFLSNNLVYNQNNLEFRFTSNNLINSQNNIFRFKLINHDKEWRYTSIFSPKAVYTNLQPNTYEFIVQAANSEGIWSSEKIQLKFHIQPHFTQTSWFKLSIILLFLLSVYLIYQNRINVIRKREQLKTSFNKQIAELESKALRSQMNPHFVFNSLNSIQNYIVKNDTESSTKYLSKFAKLTRLIFDHSQQQFITLQQEMKALNTYVELEQFRFKNKFKYSVNFDKNVDENSIEIPPLIIQPFIENAIWHGIMHKETENEVGEIDLDIKKIEDYLEIKITDNGVGRVKSAELKKTSSSDHQSSGMRLTKERLNILNLNNKLEITCKIIDLYDKQDKATGTQVIINIPIN